MSDKATVSVVDYDDIEGIFSGVGSDTIITPEEKNKSVLTPEEEPDLDPKLLETKKDDNLNTETPEEILSFDELQEQVQQDNEKSGRTKTDKSGLVDLYAKYITDGKMVAFDDFDVAVDDPEYKTKLSEYLSKFSMKDFEELHEANVNQKTREVEERIPQEFFNGLPQELQFAAKYVADGGTDLKGLFKALSQVEEVRELDPKENPREIAYQYLKATNFGNEEEIKDVLDEWEDNKSLSKRSEAFKPKLDKMQEQIVERKLVEQEQQRRQREIAAQTYITNVSEALKVPEIAGIKLDKKTHDFLTQGLLQPAYQSTSGQRTNLLGYLLEKHQMVEPNYPLIAEALWLLSDPDTYRTKLMEKGKTAQVEKTVRELKGAEQRKIGSSSNTEVTPTVNRTPNKNVYRPQTGIFKRN